MLFFTFKKYILGVLFTLDLLVSVRSIDHSFMMIWVWSLGWEDPLEEDMATHSSILA